MTITQFTPAHLDDADISSSSTRPSRSQRKGRGWADPHRIHQSPWRAALQFALPMALLGVVTAADFVVIKSSLDLALQESSSLSWTMAIGLTVAAAALMFHAGSSARKADAQGLPRRAAMAMVAAWAVFGAILVWLRWSGASLVVSAPQFQAGASSQAGPGPSSGHLVAVAMSGAYMVAGLLALLDGYRLTNPVLGALRAAKVTLAAKRFAVGVAEGRVSRLINHLAIHSHQLAVIDVERDRAVAAAQALAAHLKHHARVQIALCLGNPAATGVVRSVLEPEPPTPGPDEEDHH